MSGNQIICTLRKFESFGFLLLEVTDKWTTLVGVCRHDPDIFCGIIKNNPDYLVFPTSHNGTSVLSEPLERSGGEELRLKNQEDQELTSDVIYSYTRTHT